MELVLQLGVEQQEDQLEEDVADVLGDNVVTMKPAKLM